MRNRTELVTTTVEGSDNEESGADDSGEDWQPEKVLFSLDFFRSIFPANVKCIFFPLKLFADARWRSQVGD